MNRKSYVVRHLMTLQLFNALKSYVFEKNTKRCLIDSTLWIGLNYKLSYVKKLREMIMYKSDCKNEKHWNNQGLIKKK